jgi:hypothetical protein
MKTFREYLAESKKVYSFKVKVAGDIPENFEKDLKERLEKHKVITFAKMKSTPVQKTPLDFPELTNKEVTTFDVVLEYPVTAPEISADIRDMGVEESCYRVRGSGEPSEIDQLSLDDEPSGEALLDETDMDKGIGKINHKDYFGNDFNKSFLKDLSKTAKDRNKEEGKGEYKLPKAKEDKAGKKSAIGS